MARRSEKQEWLVLVHSIPPKPAYLRAKVGRRLQQIGAVPIKNSVYVLPMGDQPREDFQWVMREIKAGGGDAYLIQSRLIGGLTDAQIESLFRTARDVDYEQIAAAARELLREPVSAMKDAARRARAEAEQARLARRMTETVQIDFFRALGRSEAEDLVRRLHVRFNPKAAEARPQQRALRGLSGPGRRTWVTRAGVGIDRMASAWLVRRFIDRAAIIKFVAATGYRPQPGEIRFDMFEAEITHEGDLCTFEVLVRRLRTDDPALAALAEIVHDIDLKDAKFKRVEAAGLNLVISGISSAHADDAIRLTRSAAVFDDLYAYFGRRSK